MLAKFFPIVAALAAIVCLVADGECGETTVAGDTLASDTAAGDAAADDTVADNTVADNTVADGVGDLQKTLAEVLRARRPEEFAFIDRVVELVDHGTLPRDMVVSTFNWARKKPRNPFQYFEFGLRERAKKIGVSI